MYKIALTQLWDKGGYGYCGSIPNPFGHYISQFEALNISISNIDELTQLAKSRPNLTLNIVMLYNMGDYTLCLICTSYIKIHIILLSILELTIHSTSADGSEGIYTCCPA